MIDLDECLIWLKDGSYKKICLQFPDHLLLKSKEIALYIQKYSGAQVYTIGDAAYENCCSDKCSVDHIQADACIHFGHACLSCTSDIPTFYILPKESLDVNSFVNEFYKYFCDETREILFFYSVSFAHAIEEIYRKLKPKYKNLVVTRLNCDSNVTFTTACINDYHSTILGRSYNLPTDHQSETYEAVYLGSNDRTLMSLSMSIPVKAWHYFDSSSFHEYNILTSTWLKRRNFLIEKIKDAQTFGIIVASLNIKHYLKITEMLKEILKKVNKKTYLFNVGKINPAKLANFQEVDIFVLISCPESSLFNSRDYFKPIVTPFEVELAFNSARAFSFLHAIDFKQMLPGGQNYQQFKISSNVDISLTSGKIQTFGNDDLYNSAFMQRSLETIVNKEISTNIFESRTWNGLEQKLGEKSVTEAVKGRSGIPVNYANELL